MVTPWQAGYVLVLAWLAYGMVKSFAAYKSERKLAPLLMFSILLIMATEFWVQAYGGRVKGLLDAYRPLLILLPVVAFAAYYVLEGRAFSARKEKEKIQGFFEHYVNPDVIRDLHRKGHVELGGEKRTVTILVTDVRGSTALCVKHPPETIVKALNAHFEMVTKVILDHGGLVDKITGDGVMAVFNAPLDTQDHALKAFRAAEEIQRRMVPLNKELQKEKLPYLEVGAGIDVGEGVVGNIGSKHMVRYTVIGDVANTANRAQGFAEDGEIVLTENAYHWLKGKVKASGPEEVEAKGKGKMNIYKVKVV